MQVRRESVRSKERKERKENRSIEQRRKGDFCSGKGRTGKVKESLENL